VIAFVLEAAGIISAVFMLRRGIKPVPVQL
jgi:hypothetical protein